MHLRLPVVLLVLVVAAGCGGGGDDRAETTPRTTSTEDAPPPEPKTKVTLAPAEKFVRDGRSYRLSGTVDDPTIREVGLYAGADAQAAKLVRRVSVRSTGSFRTRVRPRRSVRYWARATGSATGESNPAQVSVALVPKVDIQEQGIGSGRAVVTWRARNAKLTRKPGSKSCLYTRPKGRKAWQRVSCKQAKRTGGRLVATFAISGAQNGDRFTQCARGDIARGFDDVPVAGCGRKRIRRLRAA